MKKILLVGVYSEMLNDIKEYLSGKYTVQFCPMVKEQMAGMTRIFKPNLIVMCITDEQLPGADIFEWMKQNRGNHSFLFAGSSQSWNRITISEKREYEMVYTPFSRDIIQDACDKLVSSERKKVMIVDDNALVLRNIKTILSEKYDVVLANSGELALSKIKAERFDAVLLDYEMPGMNGKETFAAMKLLPGGSDVPVIFLTSVADKERTNEVLMSRPAGYIIKPPNQNKLIELIESVS